MGWIEVKSVELGSPHFADIFEGREGLEGLQPPPIIIGIDEVGEMRFELRVAVIVVPFDGGLLDRPVHPFDLAVGPWMFDLGDAVLDYFAGQSRYNLVFAPHVMFFRRAFHASVEHRRIARRGKMGRRFFGHPNILIDSGSEKSVDITYTPAADIYLGDVSSQIYEFIAQPRPTVFLNVHHSNWRNNPNYAHWRLGPVVDAVGDLEAALETAQADRHYRDAQALAFEYTFSVDASRSAADRAANAIVGFLERLPART